jgi:hypothetical protein
MSLLNLGLGGAAAYFGAKHPPTGFDMGGFGGGGGAPTEASMFPNGLPTYTAPRLYDNQPVYSFFP